MKFKITTTRINDDCVIAISGSLDSGTCPVAEKRINDIISREGGNTSGSIVLDFKNLLYISSLGLRILFKLAKERPSKIKIINVPSDIMDIFRMVGMDKTVAVSMAD
ncbi:MAG: STAS domain-containing protein [Synergistaceae bacterium]|nr:STAS domain-containing protein [Synergistaceae bacterium]